MALGAIHVAAQVRIASRYNGDHRIGSTVTLAADGSPLSRQVRLHDRQSGAFIRRTWSDAQGLYAFEWVDGAREYVVYALDHTNQNNAAIADRPPVEPMP